MGFYQLPFARHAPDSPEEPDNRKLDYRLIYNNCAISRFDFVDNRIMMVYHNRADFLTDELIS